MLIKNRRDPFKPILIFIAFVLIILFIVGDTEPKKTNANPTPLFVTATVNIVTTPTPLSLTCYLDPLDRNENRYLCERILE